MISIEPQCFQSSEVKHCVLDWSTIDYSTILCKYVTMISFFFNASFIPNLKTQACKIQTNELTLSATASFSRILFFFTAPSKLLISVSSSGAMESKRSAELMASSKELKAAFSSMTKSLVNVGFSSLVSEKL